MQRLNWGCGPTARYGWINADIDPWPGVQIVGDVLKGLPLAENSIDYIVSIHVLPEIAYNNLDATLRELHRVLKPGGVLRLSLPDMDRAIRAYQSGDRDYFLIGDEVVKDLSAKLVVQLTWFGRSRCLFTDSMTRELLERNGFGNISSCEYQQSASGLAGITELDDRPLESFFIEGTKVSS